jgi:membrane protein implicated in regulation of membrane protease activity
VELLNWWNLVFLLPALAALLYLLLTTVGLAPIEGHDADLDAHADIDADADGDHGLLHDAFGAIGVGRIPLSLVLMSFAFLWGFFGWVGNRLFGALLGEPALFIWPSLLLALVAAAVLTRFLATRLGRLMPATESYGAASRELVGRVADVRYALTETSGSVQLHDNFGTLHEVPARVMPGEDAIPAGAKVVLWRFNEAAGAYFAIQDEAISDPGTERLGLPGRRVASD